MGIFWADQPVSDPTPQPLQSQSYDWLWAYPVVRKLKTQPLNPSADTSDTPSKCPVDHTKLVKKTQPPSNISSESASKCPVDHNKLNPNNMMPNLSQQPAPGQRVALPTERTVSSIPKGSQDDSGNWEYPSPQQMLNAMIRKSGPDGIDEDAVESMVDVHNFLNEGVWLQVLDWERKYTSQSQIHPRLLKFQGRPQEMSPRAQMLQWRGWLFPDRWGCPEPFDRHDWVVLRSPGAPEEQKVRYVIDFYEAPDDGDMPAFSVDVRPALDNLQNAKDRFARVFDKAMGH